MQNSAALFNYFIIFITQYRKKNPENYINEENI